MKFTELFSNAKFVTASKKSVNPQMRGSFYIDKVNENSVDITVDDKKSVTLANKMKILY